MLSILGTLARVGTKLPAFGAVLRTAWPLLLAGLAVLLAQDYLATKVEVINLTASLKSAEVDRRHEERVTKEIIIWNRQLQEEIARYEGQMRDVESQDWGNNYIPEPERERLLDLFQRLD